MTKRPLSWRLVVLVAAALMALSLLGSAQSARAASVSPRELVPLLTRSGIGPDWTIIDVIYAPPIFFDVTGIPMPPPTESGAALAFMLQETVHDGELPIEIATAFLLLPGGSQIDPYEATVTTEDAHHRVSRLLFERPGDWPATLEDESGAAVLKLVVPMRDGSYSVANTFQWSVPVEIGA